MRRTRKSIAARVPAQPAGMDRPVRNPAVEVARALGISVREAEAQLAEARTLTQVFPETLDELSAGRVAITQVRALIEATSALDDTAARAVQEKVLPRMSEQTPEATRKALSHAVLKADPEGTQRRHEAECKDHRTTCRGEPSPPSGNHP